MANGNRLLGGLSIALAAIVSLATGSEVTGCGSSSNNGASADGGNGDGTAGSSNGASSGASGGGSSGASGGGSSGTPLMGDGSLSTGIFGGSSSGASGGATLGSCLKFGSACTTNGDCCSGDCNGSLCAYPACTSDGQACTMNGDCCSQTCTGSKCAALNSTLKTLGNGCTSGSQCASSLCSNGTCQASSFCGQAGDACATGTDCCTGTCTIATGNTLGTCSASAPGGPANCGMVDGVLCGGTGVDGGVVYKDGGLPSCGGGCCSRACAPFGPTGVLVCQPASGCHVVGDLCTQDSDCCGSAGIGGAGAGNVTCTFSGDGGMGGLGVCRNPIRCKPDGDVCKLKTMSCNASCDCCAGNCETMDTCKQDNVGVPRCAPATCVQAGGGCASSASCCNHLPCIPNPNPGDAGAPRFVCGTASCVPQCGACTNNADCCPGSSCAMDPGSAVGKCGPCNGNPPPPPADGGTSSSSSGGSSSGVSSSGGSSSSSSSGGPPPPPPDAGKTCALYGQQCVTSADCCNNIPCSGGFCVVF
ncbi:MAG: hypothetical protein ACRENE_06765 [Polyangiaceae bacterium]